MGRIEDIAAMAGLTNSQIILLVSATCILMLGAHFITSLHHERQVQNAHFPQFPVSSVWGHLKYLDEFYRRRETDRHPDYMFTDIWHALNRPPLFLLDLRPINARVCVVASHEVAEQITKPSKLFPWSVPKYRGTVTPVLPLIGQSSLLGQEGAEWKALRKQFNPGFAPQHLATLLPRVVDKVVDFVDVIDHAACDGKPIPLAEVTANLTFDITGTVVLDLDMHAQKKQGAAVNSQRDADAPQQGKELQSIYNQLVSTYDVDSGQYRPWWLIPRTMLKREYLARKADKILKDVVRQRFALTQQYQQQQRPGAPQTRDILSLSLNEAANDNKLTFRILQDTADQLKTFLFAGWDTTGVMLAWALYELSRSPKALATVRAELDELFGPGTASDSRFVCEKLRSAEGESIIQRMPYITAVLKETLRLYPPAATARTPPPGSNFTVTTPDNGQEYCLDGMLVYICPRAIQRDPVVYGEAAGEFVPERWLNMSNNNPNNGSGSVPSIPAGAWRPFERGPRHCIGQELAMIEGRVLLAVVSRRYDFVKVGLGQLVLDQASKLPVLDNNGRQWKVQSELYSTRKVTAKPVDGMMMKVRVRSPAPTTA